MKNTANAITFSRIFLSLALLFFKPYTFEFYIIFILALLSDVLDGFIARKTKTASKLGALLDSISDMVMVGVLFVLLFPVIKIPSFLVIWIILIGIIRIIGLGTSYYKYHTLGLLHTLSNKLTGIFLFAFIIFYPYINSSVSGSIVCAVASISAIEELIIHIKSKELERDKKGILFR